MAPPPIYVINLDRRPDRLAALSAHLDRLGLSFERIAAIDGAAASFAARAAGFARTGPVGPLHNGALACSMSHALAWRTIIDSGVEAALILEDDAELSAKTAAFLDAFGAARLGLDLVRLERKSNERGLFVEKSGYELANCELRRLHSLHAGAAAYILSRRGAETALERFHRINIPLDHYLFNPARGTVFAALKPFQVFPALARQSVEIGGGKSDIGVRAGRGNILTGARRFNYHFQRTMYEAGPFFVALAGLAAGRLMVRRVEEADAAKSVAGL